MVVFRIDASLLFGPVAQRRSDPLVVALRDGDARRHFVGLQLGIRVRCWRTGTAPCRKPPLRILDHAAPYRSPGL